MNKLLLFLALILLSALIACEKQMTGPEPISQAEIEKQIRSAWEEKFVILTTMDLAGWERLFSTREFLGYVSGGHYTISSRQAFMDSMVVWWGGRASQNGVLLQMKVHPLEVGLALLDYTSKWQIVNKNGTSLRVNVTNSSLYRKEEGGWKIIYEQEAFGPAD